MTSLTLDRRDGYLLTSSIASAHVAMPVALSKIMMDTEFLCGEPARIQVSDEEAGKMVAALDSFLDQNAGFGSAVTDLRDRISLDAGFTTKAMLREIAEAKAANFALEMAAA